MWNEFGMIWASENEICDQINSHYGIFELQMGLSMCKANENVMEYDEHLQIK